MEARELAEALKEWVDLGNREGSAVGVNAPSELHAAETTWAHEDSDFFVNLGDEGRFLVAVMKVSE